MHKWYSIFPRNPWLSIYTWIIFCFLPFFFIFRSSSPFEVSIGITLLTLFFLSYIFSFKSKSGLVYMWLSFEMMINIVMTLLFGFVYFALFTAFFIGNIRSTTGFFIMYGLHIISTVGAVTTGFIIDIELFLPQVHFITLSLIGIILLPFHLYNRNNREQLEGQLAVANERISELIVFEERQRIARDLHDTLGQKLSLIGLKSDLVHRLISANPEKAKQEIQDIRVTASTALKEVRELVSNMRSRKLPEEMVRIKQVLRAADIQLTIHGEDTLLPMPPITENVLSMCLKEAVTNIVKHSFSQTCDIVFEQQADAFIMHVQDDGIGISGNGAQLPGSGLQGMRERLEFVNGHLQIKENHGTRLTITIPIVLTNIMGGESE
ncbi:sensor histidine kinase [Ornithinibacillus gellani]|uniref:sensor histidine kinase n=1 Tax=Ornithinibacillus gellani TaxID=2293253 RepID=UPI000F45FB76|nr:sensor histidine kinase [Ornithinibacillus gellani]TQS70573.1 sensor histidine kinase [Ornithinibacillus gellani]